MIWLWLSALMMVLVACVHSVLGERRLIGPILAMNDGVVARPLGRQVLRFAWHLTSLLMVLSAITIVWQGVAPLLVAIIGGTWLAVGLFDGAYTRGRHVGWPFLTLAGGLALVGAML